MTDVISTWPLVGIWETSSVDPDAVEKDEPVLKSLLEGLHPAVSDIRIEVTIHGRRWTFRHFGPRYLLVGVLA